MLDIIDRHPVVSGLFAGLSIAALLAIYAAVSPNRIDTACEGLPQTKYERCHAQIQPEGNQ